MNFTEYVTLGRSGLCVSRLALGTMTFGTETGYGADETASAAIFDRYVEAGGNFTDTADMYSNGRSEEILGKLIRDRGLKDRMVVATKFTFNRDAANPNSGGNGRKNIYRALESSLTRLGLDAVDLYWLHAWDMVTPVEEVVSTLSTLVRSGKIRYYGFSDVPAWYAARAYTLAVAQGMEPPIALQLEYSLVERSIEREHIPAAQELGLAITPWSPLASGFLAGKYKREAGGSDGTGDGRLELVKTLGIPAFNKFTAHNWGVLEVLMDVAKEAGRTPAEVALNWVATQPGITSTLIGATRIDQLESNLRALDFTLSADARRKLDEVSRLEPIHPYVFFGQPFQGMIHGSTPVRKWMPAL